MKHGMCGTRTYWAWANMIQRATNPNFHQAADYSSRGITVCERWLKFENFYADMGICPDGLTLERKDNDKGYCLENCKWATRSDQQRNRRSNKTTHLTREQAIALRARTWHPGEKKQVAAELGIHRTTLRRILDGKFWWSKEKV